MAYPGTPTFDQLRIFLAVAETGSFAAAGRRLNRGDLGNQLWHRQSRGPTRPGAVRPRDDAQADTSVAGQAMIAEARTIAHGIDGLRAKAKGLLEGLEAELSLAVDVMVPAAQLGDLLKSFQREFPTVSLRLHVEALGAVADLVLSHRARIGISGPLTTIIQGADQLERIHAGSVKLVPVAAPDHPLAKLHPVPPGATRDHIQLVLTDRSPLTRGRDFSVLSSRTWRLADLGAKHALLREGIGWGSMPLPMIEPDLVDGTLVRLALPDQQGIDYMFDAIYRTDTPPGPAGSWLLQHVAARHWA